MMIQFSAKIATPIERVLNDGERLEFDCLVDSHFKVNQVQNATIS